MTNEGKFLWASIRSGLRGDHSRNADRRTSARLPALLWSGPSIRICTVVPSSRPLRDSAVSRPAAGRRPSVPALVAPVPTTLCPHLLLDPPTPGVGPWDPGCSQRRPPVKRVKRVKRGSPTSLGRTNGWMNDTRRGASFTSLHNNS